MVVVAQLVRASVCGTEGRGFEPHLPPKCLGFLIRGIFYFIHKKTHHSGGLSVRLGKKTLKS